MHCDTWTLEDAHIRLIDGDRGKNYPKQEDFSGSGYCVFLSAKNVTSSGFQFTETIYIGKERHNLLRAGVLERGDIVLTTRGTIGNVAFYDSAIDYPVIRINSGMIIVRADPEAWNARFLYYVLTSDLMQDQIRSLTSGSAVPQLPARDLKRFKLPRISLSLQNKIESIISSIVDRIKINHQTNQTLELMAQAIFKSWFVDFEPVKAKIAALEAGGSEDDALLAAMQAIAGSALFATDVADADAQTQLARLQTEHPEQYATLRATAELFPSAMQESELGEIPEGWSVESVSDLFELHRGFDLPKNSREEGPFEVYAAGGLHGTHSEFKMEPPGIITGRSGVIGNVYLSLKKYWPLNTTLYVREFRACGPYYAYHLLGSLDLKALNSGSAVPSLNRNFVHSLATLKPCSGLLDMFEVIANSFFKEIVVNIDQNESLEKIRDTLLPKLLSGELSLAAGKEQLADTVEPAHV